ncbi:hypothetical protein [Uliginosibacterium sp. 31-12]|uniref:hypothetical protein n=1 Tax=Uliginosibacterium sp. 31-12 TaxID=3062781 RepID=UPI0026E344CD|nr:hypothetical protein [Uliginosibacterium sp. 31-12]
MAGFDADVYGLESESIDRYEIFCVFTLSKESKSFIADLPPTANIVIFPNTDTLNSVDFNDVEWKRFESLKLVARSDYEYRDYTNKIDAMLVLRAHQWFIAPFQFIKDSAPSTEKWSVDLLAMVEPARSIGLYEALDFLSEDANNLILTNDVLSIEQGVDKNQKSKVLQRFRYGGCDWFECLSSAKYLYESNDRVTSSVLEKLWMGGGVLVDKDSSIISELKHAVRISSVSDRFVEIRLKSKKNIYGYHSNVVAATLVNEIKTR